MGEIVEQGLPSEVSFVQRSHLSEEFFQNDIRVNGQPPAKARVHPRVGLSRNLELTLAKCPIEFSESQPIPSYRTE